jgi:type IV pilus assembly protein PilW
MSHARRPNTASRRGLKGFSLIEIMVGMVIAMIGVIIMMEVLLTSDQRTRTSSSGNDALSSGAVMLHMMQRDLTQAGYGINAIRLLGCNLVLPGHGAVVPLAPVVVNSALLPAGDPNTDTLLVFAGNDHGQPEGNAVQAIAGSSYTMQAPSTFAENDYVVAHPGNCAANLTLARVTALTPVAVTVNTVQAGAATLYNLGKAPKIVAYAVRGGSLTSCDFMTADCRNPGAHWTAVVGNIVALRAQYGRDTTAPLMDGHIDLWDRTTPTSACGWARASAVRFALLARSSQFETMLDGAGQRVCNPVTPQVPTWSGSTGPSTATFNLAANPDGTANTEWQCYRYKTFENVAPTRNVVWMGVQAGC